MITNSATETWPAIRARGVEKRYGEVVILRSIDLDVRAKERVALMGPSGSGKTTLLNCLGGLDRPTAGGIWIHGVDLKHLDHAGLSELRKDVTTIFQFFHLLPTLTAAENIEFPLRCRNVSATERRDRVRELIRKVGLESRLHAFPETLSGGEMQRVAIARALVLNPKIILADEPTGNLDSKTAGSVLDLIQRLCEDYRTSLVLATHSQEAAGICDRTLNLREGSLDSSG